MALDHFVSQVHLRNFYSPLLGRRLHAIRKRDLKTFTPDSASICRIENGSTNAYLREDRAIEEFLKTVEPNYNAAVALLRGGTADPFAVYTIAGFAAFVMSTSPTAMRTLTNPLRTSLTAAAEVLDAAGSLPRLEELEGKSLTQLIREGTVEFRVDPKYPQAIGIAGIQHQTARLGNFYWDLMHADPDGSPFLTSDFPAAVEQTHDARLINRIVPLAPDLALRIVPHPGFDWRTADLSFEHFRYRSRRIGRSDVRYINKLIAQCAEDLVISRDDSEHFRCIVKKYRTHRVETRTQRIPRPHGGSMIISRQVVVPSGTSNARL